MKEKFKSRLLWLRNIIEAIVYIVVIIAVGVGFVLLVRRKPEEFTLHESYNLVSMEYTETNAVTGSGSAFLLYASYRYDEETEERYKYMYSRDDGGIMYGEINFKNYDYPENVKVVIYEDDTVKPKLEIWRDYSDSDDEGDLHTLTEYRFTIPTGSIINYYNPQGLEQKEESK